MSLFSVVEFSYEHTQENKLNGSDVANTGESVYYISPGIKWTISSTIIEALVKVPVSQRQKGNQLRNDLTLLLGFRYMF